MKFRADCSNLLSNEKSDILNSFSKESSNEMISMELLKKKDQQILPLLKLQNIIDEI